MESNYSVWQWFAENLKRIGAEMTFQGEFQVAHTIPIEQ
jgi:hypothetical protein